VSEGIKTVMYPVTDLARAKAMFSAVLGAAPVMDEPYYVQFNAGDQNIGLDPHGGAWRVRRGRGAHRPGLTARALEALRVERRAALGV
jgi:catechol 2,3-dioxygenase-like lactoylglutathione lyase family enzyme